MILENYLIPDMIFDTFRDVTFEFLKSENISVIICDIDNTLVTYDDALPTEDVMNWYKSLRENNIKVAFVSNNHKERVELFNSKLGAIAYYDSHKPNPDRIYDVIKETEVSKSNAAFLGDQLLTDCACAKRAGIKCYIVPPIKDKTTPFFKAKRLLEKPYMRKYKKLHKSED